MTPPADPPSPGFSLTVQGGRIAIETYGEADSPLLQIVEDDGACVLLLGRLYYRADLARRLRRAPDRSAPDAAFALATYAELGAEACAALEGEFAIVILDRRNQRLLAWRDPGGGYPLYWTRTGDGFAIANHVRPLVGFTKSAEVERAFLADMLGAGYIEVDRFERSALRGIERLVPGTSLTVDLAGRDARIDRVWDWRRHIQDPGTDDLQEIGARYAALLRQAVAERARGTVAAHISGGMDSTSVAYLALERLAASGRTLHGVSIEYASLRGLRDEAPYLAAALRRPGITRHAIAGDELLDFDHLDRVPLLDEPCPGLFRAGIDMALVDAAACCGADTVLTGLGADELLSDAPFYIADLLRAGRVGQALSEAAIWARATTSSRWKFLRTFGLAPLLPASTPRDAIPSWVLPGFVREYRMRERALDHVRRERRAAETVVLSEALTRLSETAGDWTRGALASRRGLHVAHPFRDPRLIGFALGVRARVRPDPHRQKVVLSNAMRSVLPPIILERRGKAPFNAVYFRGLSRNLARLEAMIEASPVDELGLFDKAGMIEAMRETALGGRSPTLATGLNNGLAIAHWLSRSPRWTDAVPKPSRVLISPTIHDAPGEAGTSHPRQPRQGRQRA